jgi:hypothetical protein
LRELLCHGIALEGSPVDLKAGLEKVRHHMAVMKRELSDTPDGRWRLVYDTDHHALYVEATGLHGTERIGIDSALTLTGAGVDQLRLAIVDLFKASD